MYKRSKPSENRIITPAEAVELLKLNTFAGQRTLTPQKVDLYEQLIEKGYMRPFTVGIARLPDGGRVLMNGQHCLTAVSHTKPCEAFIEHWKCATDQDAWELFASYDVHATRTEGVIIKAARHLMTDTRLHDMSLRLLQAVGSALLILGDGKAPRFDVWGIEKSTKPRLLNEHPEDAVWISQLWGHKHLRRVGIVAAMIATHRANPTVGDQFWRAVGNGEDLKRGQPSYELREALQSPMPANNSQLAHERLYVLCVSWWNSHMTGDRRKFVRLSGLNSLPEVLS